MSLYRLPFLSPSLPCSRSTVLYMRRTRLSLQLPIQRNLFDSKLLLSTLLHATPTMSSRAPPVELDFLGLRAGEHHGKSSVAPSSSIRGMETSAIARIDPQLLRRVVVARPPVTTEEAPAAAPSPMTVFYNGSVAIFDVSHDKAEAIMRMARDVTTTQRGDIGNNTLIGNSGKDNPLARTKSLQQFLQKRKERLTRLNPYQLGGPGGSKSLRVKKEAEAA